MLNKVGIRQFKVMSNTISPSMTKRTSIMSPELKDTSKNSPEKRGRSRNRGREHTHKSKKVALKRESMDSVIDDDKLM